VDLRLPPLDIPVSRLFVELQWPDGYDLKFKGSLQAGVNVQVPRSGQRSRFEQLLVVDGCATLIAEYIAKVVKEPPAGLLATLRERLCCHRRGTSQ